MPRQGKRKRDQETGGTREGASDKRSQPPTDPDGNSIQFNFGVQPTENDIILGRGVLHVNHQGNARYYELLDAHMPAYDAAPTKGAKTKIVRSIFQQLQERRARFLKKDSKQGGLYHPITPKQAKKRLAMPSGIAKETSTMETRSLKREIMVVIQKTTKIKSQQLEV